MSAIPIPLTDFSGRRTPTGRLKAGDIVIFSWVVPANVRADGHHSIDVVQEQGSGDADMDAIYGGRHQNSFVEMNFPLGVQVPGEQHALAVTVDRDTTGIFASLGIQTAKKTKR